MDPIVIKKGMGWTMEVYDVLNSILVNLFNDILNIEEKALITEEFKGISVTDMHIIEAIGVMEKRTMSKIAKSLSVTMGTLTIGVNGLVKKGYVERNRSEKDRRIVYASLTVKGKAAYVHHMRFHKDMINSVINDITEEEAEILTRTLKKLEDYFKKLDL